MVFISFPAKVVRVRNVGCNIWFAINVDDFAAKRAVARTGCVHANQQNVAKGSRLALVHLASMFRENCFTTAPKFVPA